LQLPETYEVSLRRSSRSTAGQPLERLGDTETLLLAAKAEGDRLEFHRQVARRAHWHDSPFALAMSLRAALHERGEEARPVIMDELQQMVDKRVWSYVDVRSLSTAESRAIIRSSMFLKDKYLSSGAFQKFKARLVAGGNQQDKTLYNNLSSPTASTTSVLTVAAIAAAANRWVLVIDIGGAYLNASTAPTCQGAHASGPHLDRHVAAN
jgi:hypothetical protein